MLPRTKSLHAFALASAVLFVGALLVQPPAKGFVRFPPKVTIQELLPDKQNPIKVGKQYSFHILQRVDVPSFSLVGLTWRGKINPETVMQVKVHDHSGWSTWQELSYSPEHGPDVSDAEAKSVRFGTDPLITAVSDGIQVRVISRSASLPSGLKVSLIDSATSSDDVNTFQAAKNLTGVRQSLGSVITRTGAVVSRPNIVTRAQWGANESWRERTPRISSKIIAGFVHHTATTNSYNPEDGPAQMRSLYAYFTKSLKYADMGYNFLVDQYGVVYEGRAGCASSAGTSCDGPSKAVIGAHTAGMNDNTFAISAIGNFQTTPIDETTANLMTNAIAGLMAWKIAPYNLDPSAMARIPSNDNSGLSKYKNGTVATVPVISGHRDVGRTVCPGKYLYPLIPEIRNKIAGLLVAKVQNVVVAPLEQLATNPNPISLKATVPISATWIVTVLNAESGEVVYVQSGNQEGKSNLNYEWNHTDTNSRLVPAGTYAVSLSVTVADKQLPIETTMVTLGRKPARMTGVKIKRVADRMAVITWPVQADTVPLIDAIFYRTSSTKGRTWSTWKKLPESATEKSITSALKKRRILIEIKQTNAMGDSKPVQVSFVTKS